nr:reverse transcriptase domain-containing protein [Tanacetum cinerariifolium]
MQTRSSSRLVSNPSSNLTPSTKLNPKGHNRGRSKQRIEEFNREELSPPLVTMVDQHNMAQLLQVPTKGYEDAIVVPAITADNFELKHALIINKEKLSEMARTPLNEHCSAVLLKKLPKKLGDPGKFLIPCDFPKMDECLALADIGASINLMPLSFLKIERALIDVFEGELTLRVGKEAITFNLDQTSRYSANYSDMTAKCIDVIDMACEDDFLLEEVDAFLAFEDDPTSPKVDQSYLNSEGDILLLEAFLSDDPSLPPPNQRNYMPEVRKELKICEAKSEKSSIDEPQRFEYGGEDRSYNGSKVTQASHCLETLRYQGQEVLKLLDARLIYPISDSPWVSPVYCVPKKGGFTVVENEDNELILTRLVMGWRVCIDYRKLNEATRKDRFPLPFMDQMLERLAGNQYYYFLDDFSG